MTELIIVGVVIGGTELLLHVTDYLLTHKTRNLEFAKKDQKHYKKVKTDRENTEKDRSKT